jgi:hypothetical protein
MNESLIEMIDIALTFLLLETKQQGRHKVATCQSSLGNHTRVQGKKQGPALIASCQ